MHHVPSVEMLNTFPTVCIAAREGQLGGYLGELLVI